MRLNKKLAALGGAVVLVAGGATMAVAAIPDSTSGEVTACYTTTGGQVRLIDKENGASCHSYETEVAWPSEAGGGFNPKRHLTVYDGASGGVGGLLLRDQDTTCPEGEKLVDFKSYEYYRNDPHPTDWSITSSLTDRSSLGHYIEDGSGTVVGWRQYWTSSSDLAVWLVCSE